MEESGRGRSIWAVIIVGATYLAIGLGFAALAAGAGSHESRAAWRLAAWVISAVLFTAHIAYEQLRPQSAAPTTALRAAAAVALGALALGVAALVHTRAAAGPVRYLAFLIWPVVGGLPAFGVAFALASVLARVRRGT